MNGGADEDGARRTFSYSAALTPLAVSNLLIASLHVVGLGGGPLMVSLPPGSPTNDELD